jgi:hypothetical protein
MLTVFFIFSIKKTKNINPLAQAYKLESLNYLMGLVLLFLDTNRLGTSC